MPGNYPRISLCMIVKDEEATLGRCLASVRGIADEMVVVDTGSTDGTVRIAEDFGAAVYHHPWENDFSRHRNQAIGYAGGEWILVMDADEVIAPRDVSKVRELTSFPGADGYRFILRNYENNPNLANLVPNPGDYEEGRGLCGFIPVSLVRLFRNGKGIRFTGAVHETVDGSFQKLGLTMVETRIPIHHYGKVLSDRIARKAETYRHLGEEKLRREPGNPSAYKGLADQYLESGEPGKALGILNEGIARFPDLVELRFNRGVALDRLDRREEARRDYEWVLARVPDHTGACHNLGRIYLDGNQAEETIRLVGRGVERGIRHPAVLSLLGRAFGTLERWGEALDAFDRVLAIQPGYPGADYHRAVVLSNFRRYDAAIEALEREIKAGGNLAAAYTLLGEISIALGDPESATQFFRKALSLKPGDIAATRALEQIDLHDAPTTTGQ